MTGSRKQPTYETSRERAAWTWVGQNHSCLPRLRGTSLEWYWPAPTAVKPQTLTREANDS